jgi:dihydropteroate synthase
MKLGFENGADIINDISGFTDNNKIKFVSKLTMPIIVMHIQNQPHNNQNEPKYSFAPVDIYNFFLKKINELRSLGVDSANIMIDPGIGFGKNKFHNLDILRNLTIFHSLGVPILVGLSRKSLIEELTVDNYRSWGINKKSVSPSKRLSGSIAFAIHAINSGVQIIRTHDVFETKQAMICQRALT